MSQSYLRHPSIRTTSWAKTEPRQSQTSSYDDQHRPGPSRAQASTSGFREPLHERHRAIRQEFTPRKGLPLDQIPSQGGQYQAAKRVDSLGNDLAVMTILADIQENSRFLASNCNTVRSQQSGHPVSAVEPRNPIASASNALRLPSRPVLLAPFSPVGDLRFPGRSKKAKPSSGTAATRSQALSSGNIIHPLATSGAAAKRKIDTVTPTMANPKKEPKEAGVSFEITLSAAAPMATVSESPNARSVSADDVEEIQDHIRTKICPVLFSQELHPLRKFKGLAMKHPLKITKAVVKQKKLISVLKGKDIVNFVHGLPHSVVHRTPSTSQPTVSLASASSSTKGKGKEMPFHGSSGAARKELFTSKPISDISAASASNSSITVDVKLEEGEIVSSIPFPFPEQVNQACSKDKDKLYSLKRNEVQVGESAFRPEANNVTTNANQSTRRTVPGDSECCTKTKLYNDKINDKPADASPTTTSVKRTLSVTAPNANTMEQFKVFRNLARAYKKRGDNEKDKLASALAYFHAPCNYIISFYYNEKQREADDTPSQSAMAWKTLLPFADMLLAKNKAQKQYLLYGVCLRLVSMVRFSIFNKMQGDVHGVLTRHLQASSASNKDIKMSYNLLEECEKTMVMNTSSQKYFGYEVMASRLPLTFKQVCVEGNLLSGITIGAEAGVQVSPMFPFELNASLLHGAICTKCILSEFMSSMKLDFKLIDDTDDYM
ncbi:hypothetical protein RMATCC62417_18179 [Rhizopus microsporus]|nr:hypothetical protein RMATCC62417_18179 [Rhizopus microsporus]